ncbi:MAG: hypothetical protein ACTS9Y_00575 [Methylophilus sp.]|uniref:hypothetical protein n=1 Tax=Methylophilus sp. TaxID=29541 RepID=UPI003FA16A14
MVNPALKPFGELAVHEGKHSMTIDKFNPYASRDYTNDMDRGYFDAMLYANPEQCGLSLDYCFIGCLDAPQFIPAGSSTRITTIGGWEREEYRKLDRECDDYGERTQAEVAASEMLKEILAEVADEEAHAKVVA